MNIKKSHFSIILYFFFFSSPVLSSLSTLLVFYMIFIEYFKFFFVLISIIPTVSLSFSNSTFLGFPWLIFYLIHKIIHLLIFLSLLLLFICAFQTIHLLLYSASAASHLSFNIENCHWYGMELFITFLHLFLYFKFLEVSFFLCQTYRFYPQLFKFIAFLSKNMVCVVLALSYLLIVP